MEPPLTFPSICERNDRPFRTAMLSHRIYGRNRSVYGRDRQFLRAGVPRGMVAGGQSLTPSFGARTRSCFVPRYRSVVINGAHQEELAAGPRPRLPRLGRSGAASVVPDPRNGWYTSSPRFVWVQHRAPQVAKNASGMYAGVSTNDQQTLTKQNRPMRGHSGRSAKRVFK
jgi:hypothetical protein